MKWTWIPIIFNVHKVIHFLVKKKIIPIIFYNILLQYLQKYFVAHSSDISN